MRDRSLLLPIFLTVLIDMLGIGIIIPVLPALFFDPDSMVFATEASSQRRSLYYGLLLAAYPAMQFFGAPLLGTLSDRLGRRPVLQLSLAGTLIGYVLFGLAIRYENLGLLFFSRMLPGFTGGNIAVIYSAIADISSPEDKAKNFGLVGMAFGLGFILGPAIGGVLADGQVVAWFDPSTPFWFTAILTGINLILVQYYFRETLKTPIHTPFHPLKGFVHVATSFKAPNLRTIFSVVLLQALGFTFFTQFFSVLLIQKVGVGMHAIGLLFGYVGIWLVFTQGVVVRILSRQFKSTVILRFSILCLSLAIAALLIPDVLWVFYFINPFVAIFHGITSPNLTAVVSSQATPSQQGEIMGINQAMISIGQMVPAIIGGWLNAMNVHWPIVAASVFIMMAWVVYVFIFQKQLKPGL